MIELLTIFQNTGKPRGQRGDPSLNHSVNPDQDPIGAVKYTHDEGRK